MRTLTLSLTRGAAMASTSELAGRAPAALGEGDPTRLTRNTTYWAMRTVQNWATLKWNFMVQDIKKVRGILHQDALAAQAAADALVGEDQAEAVLGIYAAHADKVVSTWWALFDALVVRFSDGWVDQKPQGYPAAWLENVGYKQGPPQIPEHPLPPLGM